MLRTLLVTSCVAIAMAPAALRAQDAAAGGAVFKQRCAMCHSTTPDGRPGVGPNLNNIGKRAAGSTTFAYSAALKSAKIKWDAKTLDTFLTAPGRMVPGTRMVVSLPDDRQRANVVAYLMTLKN
ncbi:cytochrome c [Novosphingobium sp. SG754]|uniref:c-type cytochrome n=1 Tax=Novosphingobium sp. BK626 TaxID=2587088 RepID=UPI001494E7C0|nr:c-type cytochrome [Novosphingobium sp. BK626]MBB3479553.1 cytochrome c [Novosphingobium sp. BK369]MBB3622602.1 cytochrome c [Novosphingobium sp. BK592]NOX07188.1 cytochrome c [Novosphingobium sp. SG754]